MAKIVYLKEKDFRDIIHILQNGKFDMKKYLPPVGERWYKVVTECSDYVTSTSHYEGEANFYDICARLLYKIVKKHELHDGNKRTAVISVYLFCLMNDYLILNPEDIKKLAKRIASTKGGDNEIMIRKRISKSLEGVIFTMEEIKRKYKL
ncbi:type II toxin-antitoxin system death-on-curing family toxin [Candidatus Parcubacteria bacterium]|nr:type II toxin-antitoxin system death-on-curing family toxin [Candidatus Parcubacteria bacterium]